MTTDKTVVRGRWLWRHPSGLIGVLDVSADEDDKTSVYLVRVMPRASFLLTKLEPVHGRETTYTVTMTPIAMCGCEGWARRQTCRHIQVLEHMTANGTL